MSLRTRKLLIAPLAFLGILLGGACQTGATQAPASSAQNVYQAPIVPAPRVQVTGTVNKISLDTERADVQSVLKAVFKLAGKQFVPDATVSGQVTLLLTDQPPETVLQAICRQTYLRYAIGPDGIYRFSRDDDAIRHAFSSLSALNGQLRQQLRNLGLDLPADGALNELGKKEGSLQNRPGEPDGAANSALLNGRAGLRPEPSAARKDEAKRDTQESFAAKINRSPTAGSPAAAAKPAAPMTQRSASLLNRTNIHTNYLTQNDYDQLMDAQGHTVSPQQYQNFLRQNGLVWFNIPEEKPQPVSTVITEFSRQANVRILVDQAIPNSLKFRVWGTLSPRQLPEALNVLAPTAHLQWRWIGNSIFVFPAPDFKVYFAANPTSQNSVRYIYPTAQPGAVGGGAAAGPAGPAGPAGEDSKGVPAGPSDDSTTEKNKSK